MTAPGETGQAGDGFDHLIHAPARLRICAALDPVREIEFGALQTLLGISKSALSKHVSALAEAGYVAQRRAVRDTRQRVWLSLTPTGRSAYQGHVAALHRIVGNSQAPDPGLRRDPARPSRGQPEAGDPSPSRSAVREIESGSTAA